MTKYIERDKAVKLIFLAADTGRAAKALSLLGKESVADVVEVVRCKDCIYRTFMDWATIWCDFHEINMDQNGYCDQGSKRDGGEQP